MLRFLKYTIYILLIGALASSEVSAQTKKKKKAKKHHNSIKKHKKAKYYKPLPPPAPKPVYDFAQLQDTANPLEKIFSQDQTFYNDFLAKKDQRRIQIIYTRIDRDKNNIPSFKEYKFNVSPYTYFYPASCVKLPLAALTLEKLHQLNIPGISKETPLTVDSVNTCQYPTIWDSTASGYRASFGHYIKKILLVSDNDAYNRLFEYNGTQHIHNRLSQLNLPDIRITHRFFACDSIANKYTNRFNFLDPTGAVFYTQQSMYDSNIYSRPIGTVTVGNSYLDFDNKLKPYPKNFSDRNYFKLEDINGVLKRLIFPESFNRNQRFDLDESDYRFMRKYMSTYATESIEPIYDSVHGYFDCIKKYLVYGQKRDTVVNKQLRIFNIVGFSYGFLVDCAYIIDFETQTEFMLSAVIYSNESEILNWNKYEYYTVGMPFLKKLGQDILKLEKQRPKALVPDLSQFIFDYKK